MPANSHGHDYGHGHGHKHSQSLTGNSGPPALPNHQLGDLIGKGAFGVVYRALNWQTGEAVAVKQIALGNIPPSELPEIMSEIDLLKNLDHPNVVQYRGFVKTGDFLWIILEYCENGSLTAICKKFGKFPESLCQIYICQVLEGLLYLHEQGVIHRDIKGSNILATKEGSIKLADFGVATRVGGHDRSVVGSPYWMAPEVVEQIGATTASDIWSVGCVVIELLEGQPPYHELEPLPALFRIVNDDCPPLPDSASPVVRDFLLQCFQKDSNLRISARKLLKHPWMVSARRQLDQNAKQRLAASSPSMLNLAAKAGGSTRSHLSAYDETVQKVQAWNKALDKQQHNPTPPALLSVRAPVVKLSEDVATALHSSNMAPGKLPASPSKASRRLLAMPKTSQNRLLPDAGYLSRSDDQSDSVGPSSRPQPDSAHILNVDEDKENDNWDSDFLDGIPNTKLAGSTVPHQRSTDEPVETGSDNSDTIRPGAFPPLMLKTPSATLPTVVEDYSDLVQDDDSRPFQSTAQHLRKTSDAQKHILHPRDLSNGSQKQVRNLTPVKLAAKTMRSPLPIPPSPRGRRNGAHARIASESDNEDYSDAFDDRAMTHSRGGPQLQLTKKLSSKSWLGDDDVDDEDPFAEVEQNLSEDESSDNLEANVHREKVARMCSFVKDLLDGMNAEADELAIRDGCIYLIDIFEQTPEVKQHFVKSHGLLTIVESLQIVRSRDVISLELRIVNILIADNPESLEKICLIGGCPVIMKFSHSRCARDIRLEAALFIGAMCRTSLLTLQMFISCRGLRTLIDMMDENYQDQKDLVWMAVDGICRVFDMQGSTPRNDFCRMFAKEGLLDPLSSALLAVAADDDELAQSALHKITHVLMLFSQSDLRVKMVLAHRPIALRLVRGLSAVPRELLPALLKTIKNISMAPAALEILQNANVIECLVQILTRYLDFTEICNPLVNALYNLCRLSKTRQEEAALAGVVPALKTLVHGNSPLKQFALPILCDFANASKTCRKILWQHDIFNLYISLLKDPFWSLSALESLLSWLQDETARVEDSLLHETAVDAVLRTFSTAKATSFENILEPLLKLLRLSSALCNKLSSHASLYRRLLDRLSSHPKAVVRLNLLKLVKILFEAAVDSSKIVKQPNLVSTINRLAEDDPSLLVKDLAKGLLKDFSEAERKHRSSRLLNGAVHSLPASPGSASSVGPAGHRLGRTWSESAMSQILNHPSASSPRMKLKSRPNSPNTGTPFTIVSDSGSSSLSTTGALPKPARRISVRAKTTTTPPPPPPPQAR